MSFIEFLHESKFNIPAKLISHIKPILTFASDLAEAIREEKHPSVVTDKGSTTGVIKHLASGSTFELRYNSFGDVIEPRGETVVSSTVQLGSCRYSFGEGEVIVNVEPRFATSSIMCTSYFVMLSVRGVDKSWPELDKKVANAQKKLQKKFPDMAPIHRQGSGFVVVAMRDVSHAAAGLTIKDFKVTKAAPKSPPKASPSAVAKVAEIAAKHKTKPAAVSGKVWLKIGDKVLAQYSAGSLKKEPGVVVGIRDINSGMKSVKSIPGPEVRYIVTVLYDDGETGDAESGRVVKR